MIKTHKIVILLIVFILILTAPIIIYGLKFGIGIWSDHSKWAEMGSALSGIYSPLIALMALLILIFQVKHQINTDTRIQLNSKIDSLRSELNFYLIKIEYFLDKEDSAGRTAKSYLDELSKYPTNLASQTAQNLINKVLENHHNLSSLWIGIYSIIPNTGKKEPKLIEDLAKEFEVKVASNLSIKTCISLDRVMQYKSTKFSPLFLK